MNIRARLTLLVVVLAGCSAGGTTGTSQDSTATPAATAASAGSLTLAATSMSVAQSAGSATLSVTREGGSAGAVSTKFATANGTAAGGADYTASSGVLNWADGDAAAKSIVIPISNATPFAGVRTFDVAISAPAGGAALLSPTSATVSISGSGTAHPGTLAFAASSYAVAQNAGAVSIGVTRSQGSNGAVSVHYATKDGAATAGSNYVAASGTLNWADGDSATKSISVAITNGSSFSGGKAFSVLLSAAGGGAAIGTAGTATVTVNGSALVTSGSINLHILVDQFGYRPADTKVAVIRSPQVGYDAADTFSPGATYELHSAADDSVVMSGTVTAWNGGAVQASSGDKGWWFDFSSVTTPGTYYVFDKTHNVRSPTFPIQQNAYKIVLKAALRMYFYERAGIAKAAPHADMCWVDAAAYLGPNQDSQAHDVTDPANASKVRDMSGGWFDAGDTNKYVTFATTPVHQLLIAYQEHPSAFTDDFNIPESGNGIPDVLDEVNWEIKWLQKMQFSDGSVALKLGSTGYPHASPPSSDATPRFYVPSCTSSTITTAGMFAHASYVFRNFTALQTQASTLQAAAIKAWNNYQGIATKQTNCDTQAVKAGDADLSLDEQNSEAVVAAIYLFAATGDATYETYVKNNYTLLRPYHDAGWVRYQSQQGEALLFYTTLSNADAALKTTILADKLADVQQGNNIYGLSNTADLYRNFLADYIWGSNQVRANSGVSNAEVAAYRIAVSSGAAYQTRALDTLHYFHGVNPFAKVYLSNMDAAAYGGATNSVNEVFHAWFASGSKWSDAKTSACGPAPGFLPGGPNASAGANGVPASEIPPVGQPAQKSYKDWNGEDDAWVVNEPGIYYQSAYVQLLSAFAD